jgi:TPR repeat protein
MNEKKDFVLVKRHSSAVEKTAPSAKRILSSMVTDTLGLARKTISKEIGIADSQLEDWFQTGEKYRYGQGVTQDYTEAIKWYHKAAEHNYTKAQHALGSYYLFGDILKGVEKDYVKAVMWFRKAAEQNYAPAQSALGYRYYIGEGVEQDYAEAAKWYRKAADQGMALAQDKLGNCYWEGEGVPQDYVEAAKWWRKAAEQNYPEAQYSLGCCYEQGQGVPQDAVEAYKFYKLAAEHKKITTQTVEQNRKAAGENLKQIVTRMTAVEIAEGERRYREFRSQKI